MKKYVKGCIGFLFVLMFMFIHKDVVLAATAAQCAEGVAPCGQSYITSYICPNTEELDTDSAWECLSAIKDDDTSSLTLIDDGGTIPVKYDDTKNNLILVKAAIDFNGITGSIAFQIAHQYPSDKMELIYTYADPLTFPKKGKQAKWSISTNYNLTEELEGDYEIGGQADELEEGTILVFANEGSAQFPAPASNAPSPYYVYYVFRIKDDASGGAEIKMYDPWDPNNGGNTSQISDGDSEGHYIQEMTITSFEIGEEKTIAAPIDDLKIFSDSNKTKEYLFGQPGNGYPVAFAKGTTNYHVYLPSGTTSIYIQATAGEGGTVSGDIGTKVLSAGSGSFTIVGTPTEGDTQSYTITYHVPDNMLNTLTSPGNWDPKTFSAINSNYNVLITTAQAQSLSVGATLKDSEGGIETKFKGITKTAKAKQSSVSETLTNVADGDTYQVISYGAECFGAYNTALNECNYKTYTITYKILDRTFKSISVKDSSNDNYQYGVAAADFNPDTHIYTVYVPHSVDGVAIDAEPNDATMTRTPTTKGGSLSDGENNFTITAEALDTNEDDYKIDYKIKVYRLSDDATATFEVKSGSPGTLSDSPTESTATSGITTTKTLDYELVVGKSITATTFNTTPTESSKAFINTSESTHTASENYNISSNPYTITVSSESCKAEFASLHNNTCNKTVYNVTARSLDDDTGISGYSVRNSSGGTKEYPVTDNNDGTYRALVPADATTAYVAVTLKDASKQSFVENYGPGDVSLSSTDTTKTIKVKAEDGTEKSYTFTIHKADTSNKLATLSLTTAKLINTFDPNANDTIQAKIEKNTTLTKVNVSATPEKSTSTLRVDNTAYANDLPHSITDSEWTFANDITITVFSESCQISNEDCQSKTYTVHMNKLSSESTLTSVAAVNSTNNTEEYGKATMSGTQTNYTIALPAGTTTTKLVLEKPTDVKTENISFTENVTGLTAGNNPQTIVVTSEYGEEYQTSYSINLHVLKEETGLTSIDCNPKKELGVTPVEQGDPDPTKYTLKIGSDATQTTVTATVDSTSFINTEGTVGSDNSLSATWNFGTVGDEYTFTVYPEKCRSAYNGGTPCTTSTEGVKTYTIKRHAISTNTKPKKIKVTNPEGTETYGEIDFVNGTPVTPYKINVPDGITTAVLVVEGEEGQTVPEPKTITINPGDNKENIEITAEDGTTKEPYEIHVYQPHTEKELSTLTLSGGGELDPVFSAGQTTYTYKISEKVTSVNVSATTGDNAYINNETTGSSLTNDPWNISGNTVTDYTLTVYPEKCKADYIKSTPCTASDGTTYTIQIQKLSNSKTVDTVKVNGKDATLDTNDNKYKITLKPSETSAEVTCTALNNAKSCTGTNISTLEDGPNSTKFTITAEDGTTQDFDVEIYKISAKIGLESLVFSEGALDGTVQDGTYVYNAKFSSLKTSTNVTPTTKYNGFIDGTSEANTDTKSWNLSGDTVADYKFTVKSESCKAEFASIIDSGDCKTQEYTVKYVAISADATLDTITVKDQTGTEYFTETSINDTEYTIYMPASSTTYTFGGTSHSSSATVTLNPTAANQPITISDGDNTPVTITVTPPSGSGASAQVYTLTVHRLNDDNTLKVLSSSTGTLDPGFTSTNGTYNLNLTSDTITTTNISAEATNALAKLQINDSSTDITVKEITNKEWTFGNSESYKITVRPESCDYPTVPNNAGHCVTKDYVITRNVLSAETILAGLTVKSSDDTTTYAITPGFSTTETNYSATVPAGKDAAAIIIDPGTTGITIKSATTNTTASANKDGSNSNKVNVTDLVKGDNKVTITLLAANGTTEGTYEVTLHVNNNDASLTLTSSVNTLTKTGDTTYKLAIPKTESATQTTFTATIPSGATIKMNNVSKTQSPYTDDWTFSHDGTYTIEVTPEEGDPVTYTVTCEIEGATDSDDNSLELATNTGNISKTDDTHFKLKVANGITSAQLTATIQQDATITMGGVAITTPIKSAYWTFSQTGDTYEIVVTSQKGTPKTYTVEVEIDEPVGSGQATLNTITVTKFGGTETYTVFDPVFVPDSKTTTDYTIYVPNTTTKVNLAGTPTNTGDSVTYTNETEILLAEGDNQEKITVTLADGSDTQVYNVNIYRLCNESTLENLSVSVAALDPTFEKNTTEYSIFISTDYTSTTVTPAVDLNHTGHPYFNSETNTDTTFNWDFGTDYSNNKFEITVYSESCKTKYASVEGNSGQCSNTKYTINAEFYNPEITSEVYELTKGDTTVGSEVVAFFIDKRLYKSTDADLKGEQTDNPEKFLKLYDKDDIAEVAAGSDLGTGMILKLLITNIPEPVDIKLIVVPGDTDGDTKVNVFDILEVVDHILNTDLLEGPYFEAADMDRSAVINVFDILEIVDIILNNS